MANVVDVNPDLIRWAVDRSGLQLEDFPSAVQDWIDQKKKPTFNKLESFARKAMVPFGFLFLDRPQWNSFRFQTIGRCETNVSSGPVPI